LNAIAHKRNLITKLTNCWYPCEIFRINRRIHFINITSNHNNKCESVEISTIVTFAPQLFQAINCDIKFCPTVIDIHDCSADIRIISGKVVHDDALIT
jgi:hypothetical protein